MMATVQPCVSRCERCRWWKPVGDPVLNQGECWRYPPTIVSRVFNAGCDESLENHRPVTTALEICGEFLARRPEQSAPATPVIDETRELLLDWCGDIHTEARLRAILAEHDAVVAGRPGGFREWWIAGRDAAAEVADGFTCGGCGMDGKSSKAIRALTPPATEDEPDA